MGVDGEGEEKLEKLGNRSRRDGPASDLEFFRRRD